MEASVGDAKLDALVQRLLKHERGSRQQCTCPSAQENCAACDVGLAADEILRLRTDLAAAQKQIVELREALTAIVAEGTEEQTEHYIKLHPLAVIAHRALLSAGEGGKQDGR
jgi:hypothetical protein